MQVKFPTAEEMKRSIEEARQKGGLGGGGGGGKDKKNGHYIMIPLLLGSTLIPLAFGALAILAGKALIVSKLALALASIIGIKKLISGGHHHEGGAHGKKKSIVREKTQKTLNLFYRGRSFGRSCERRMGKEPQELRPALQGTALNTVDSIYETQFNENLSSSQWLNSF